MFFHYFHFIRADFSGHIWTIMSIAWRSVASQAEAAATPGRLAVIPACAARSGGGGAAVTVMTGADAEERIWK